MGAERRTDQKSGQVGDLVVNLNHNQKTVQSDSLLNTNIMIGLAIGISTGFMVILTTMILRKLDKPVVYGLALAGIGFLYVGYTWSHAPSLAINIVQALMFLFIAYFGILKNMSVIIGGYFLHGLWDLGYGHLQLPDLLPPHYDLFCWSIDFLIGTYLLVVKFQAERYRQILRAS